MVEATVVTQQYRTWLPTTALQVDQLEHKLSETVDEWSRKWFARQPMGLLAASGKGALGQRARAQGPWLALDEGLALAVAANGSKAVAAAMLDLSTEEKLTSPADEAVVEQLAGACFQDLKARFCRLLKLPADAEWHRYELAPASGGDGHAWSIGFAGEPPAICLQADQELLVRLARLGVSVPADVPELHPIAEGLARQSIQVSAFLGTCELTLSQVASLAPGDVVMLDRKVGAPLELLIHPADRSGLCVVDQEGEHLFLKIARPFFE